MKPNSSPAATSSRPWDKRRHRRTRVRLAASIVVDKDSAKVPCVVWDISDGGARMAAVPGVPERFTLLLSQDVRRRCQVKWRNEKFIGVQFLKD
jgi:hypothetical protein